MGYRRILICRTDRIGDVLLSTPVIRALRQAYPEAFLAMMVSPYAKEAVEGNPDLDEVIVYDKSGAHRSWPASISFSCQLRKKKFDLALILHPNVRVHVAVFFAGIPRRIGYDYKMGFLLTDRIPHTKPAGHKHELEYNLDLVRYLGVEPKERMIYMPVKPAAEAWAENTLKCLGVGPGDGLLAVHPGASCISKLWPVERFAEAAESLSRKYGLKVVVVSGPKDLPLADKVLSSLRVPAFSLAGKTTLSQLASILRRCRLLISNDSGPVHVAAAVGTPVVSIFGRAQKGLSPARWAPVAQNSRVLHRSAGCSECLAHECVKGFACLRAVSVEDVVAAASELL